MCRTSPDQTRHGGMSARCEKEKKQIDTPLAQTIQYTYIIYFYIPIYFLLSPRCGRGWCHWWAAWPHNNSCIYSVKRVYGKYCRYPLLLLMCTMIMNVLHCRRCPRVTMWTMIHYNIFLLYPTMRWLKHFAYISHVFSRCSSDAYTISIIQGNIIRSTQRSVACGCLFANNMHTISGKIKTARAIYTYTYFIYIYNIPTRIHTESSVLIIWYTAWICIYPFHSLSLWVYAFDAAASCV